MGEVTALFLNSISPNDKHRKESIRKACYSNSYSIIWIDNMWVYDVINRYIKKEKILVIKWTIRTFLSWSIINAQKIFVHPYLDSFLTIKILKNM